MWTSVGPAQSMRIRATIGSLIKMRRRYWRHSGRSQTAAMFPKRSSPVWTWPSGTIVTRYPPSPSLFDAVVKRRDVDGSPADREWGGRYDGQGIFTSLWRGKGHESHYPDVSSRTPVRDKFLSPSPLSRPPPSAPRFSSDFIASSFCSSRSPITITIPALSPLPHLLFPVCPCPGHDDGRWVWIIRKARRGRLMRPATRQFSMRDSSLLVTLVSCARFCARGLANHERVKSLFSISAAEIIFRAESLGHSELHWIQRCCLERTFGFCVYGNECLPVVKGLLGIGGCLWIRYNRWSTKMQKLIHWINLLVWEVSWEK